MKTLEKILFTIAIVLVLLVAVSFFLPAGWNVTREIAIKAPSDKIYPYISTLKTWPEWTAWSKEADPTVEYSYQGPASGKGAKQTWSGEKMGKGSVELTEADGKKSVSYVVHFDNEKMDATGSITIEAIKDGSKVTWNDMGSLGYNPIKRYFGLLIEPMLGADFDKGLAKLKEKLEHP